MAQTINTNVASLNAQRNLNSSQGSLGTTLQRLSSGLRVNSAKDDSAGLAIAERMNAQVRGMNVAIRNANDGISLAQTAEGALGKIGDNLQRMRELSVQAANGTNSASDITALAGEFTALSDENSRIVSNTKFNDTAVLDELKDLTFQVGARDTEDNQIKVNTTKTAFTAVAFTDSESALKAMKALDADIDAVNATRATFGAVQTRFESTIANLQIGAENTAAARGRILDADFATETANLSRTQILQQAGTAMLAQANSLPQNVLSLLR